MQIRLNSMAATHERDSQRRKLYRAEEVLAQFQKPLPAVADVERFVRRVMKHSAIRRRYGTACDLTRFPVVVKDGRRCRSASGTAWSITIPKWARNTHIVLHELAHVLHLRSTQWASTAQRRPTGLERLTKSHGTRTVELAGGAWHGWQFAALYLDLVHFMMGCEARDALKASFKAHKVRFRPKRVATPEQIARLAAARMRTTTAPTPAPAVDDGDWPVPAWWKD